MRLPLLFLVCVGSVLSGLRADKRVALMVAGLFLYFLALRVQHLYLATSSSYTDNPPTRLRSMAQRNRSLVSQGKSPLPRPRCEATWHTWLTELYVVQPLSE